MTADEVAKKHARLDVLDEVTRLLVVSLPDSEEWRQHKADVLGLVRWLKQQEGSEFSRGVPPFVVAQEQAVYARIVNGAAAD